MTVVRRLVIGVVILFLIGSFNGCAVLKPAVVDHSVKSVSARLDESMFVTKDGVALPFARWGNATNPHAVLVSVHGMNDYHRAFEALGEQFANAGIVTYAYDQRGHGGAPDVGHWGDHAVMASDLVEFLRLVKARHPGAALFLLGESMGAAISVLAAVDPGAPRLQGLVLSSPAIKPSTATRKPVRAVTRLAGALIPDVAIPTPPAMSSKMTDNKAVLRQMSVDPKIPRKISVGTLAGARAAMEASARAAPKLQVATLLLMGEKDPLLASANRQRLTTFLKGVIPDLTLSVYEDGHHLLLRDLQAAHVYARILDWMNSVTRS